MKKAQIHGQVFIYILTLIITAAILLYGYNAITSISTKAEQVEFVKFKNDLKQDFETISSDYGSVEVETYSVPSKVKEICFYQRGNAPYFLDFPENINPLIKDSIDDTDNNVFLVMSNAIPDPMKLSRIEISNDGYNILCIKISSNRLKLRLKGLGDGVLVEQA